MKREPIDLSRCPDCGGPVVSERGDLGTNGVSRFHVLPGGRLEFLCPDLLETPKPGERG